MVVMILEKVPPSLRGELTRWLLEVTTGIFVGKVSALVRDLLWQKALEKKRAGRCYQIYRTNNEQGFAIRMEGDPDRSLVDFDGITLIALRNAAWQDLNAKGFFSKPENLDNLNPNIDLEGAE